MVWEITVIILNCYELYYTFAIMFTGYESIWIDKLTEVDILHGGIYRSIFHQAIS